MNPVAGKARSGNDLRRVTTLLGSLASGLLAVSVPQALPAQSGDGGSSLGLVHTASVGPSLAFPLSGDEPRGSTLGADFLYRFDPRWEVGIQLDFAFEAGYKEFEGYSVVPVIAYTVSERVNVFAGAGIEHTQHTGSNHFLARVGGEYTIYLSDNKRLLLLPGSFVDYVNEEFILSFLLALGYMF